MYTIKLLEGIADAAVADYLTRFINHSKFTATFKVVSDEEIHVKPVRLKESKPYCGQHPGECFIGPQRKGRWLEWDDWVEFHGLINKALDDLKLQANVWTKPLEKMDRGSKMWVRRGLKARKHWDFTVEYNVMGRALATWNHGTPDQFEG